MPTFELVATIALHTLFGTVSELLVKCLTSSTIRSHITNNSNDSLNGNSLSLDESSNFWSWFGMIPYIAALCTALFFPCLLDGLGRKIPYMYLNNILIIAAIICGAISNPLGSLWAYIIAEIFAGISLAICQAPATIYIAECSPLKFRGQSTQMLSVGHLFWGSLTIFAVTPLLEVHNWSYALLIITPFALIHLLSSLYVRGSPKHLYLKESNVEETRRSWRFYFGLDYDEVRMVEQYEQESFQAEFWQCLCHILTQRHLRKCLLICVIAQITPVLSGLTVFDYGTYVLLWYGFSSRAWVVGYPATLLTSSVLGGLVVALLIIQRVSRKYLYLTSVFFLTLGLFFTAIAGIGISGDLFEETNPDFSAWREVFLIFSIPCKFVYFSVQPNYLAMLFLAEICPQGIRAKVAQISMVSFYGLTLLMRYLILIMIRDIGSSTIFIFNAISIVCMLWLRKNLPETRDRHVNEIVADFEYPAGEEIPLLEDNRFGPIY